MNIQAPWILWININGVGMFTYICLILMVNVGKYTGAIECLHFCWAEFGTKKVTLQKIVTATGVSKGVGSLIFL